MTINIRNININYIQYGSGSDVVLLHGWGQNIAMMKPIGDRLQKNTCHFVKIWKMIELNQKLYAKSIIHCFLVKNRKNKKY